MTSTTNRARAAVTAAAAGADPAKAVAEASAPRTEQPLPDPGAEVAIIAPRGNVTPVRGSMPEKIMYAKALAEASLLPKAYQRQPGNVLLAVEMGEALNLHPFVAIQGVHVIEGKPSASAALISALVRRAGHRLRVTGNDKQATAQIIRSDDPDFVYESVWDLDRARTAGLLGKGVWKSYPAAMLKARAITEVARDACQEALSGVQYTPEELGAQVDGDGEPVSYQIEQQPVAHVDGRDWYADVALCQAVDDCRELYKQCHAAGAMTPEIATAISERAAGLTDGPTDGADVVTGEVVEPTDADYAAMNAEASAQAKS